MCGSHLGLWPIILLIQNKQNPTCPQQFLANEMDKVVPPGILRRPRRFLSMVCLVEKQQANVEKVCEEDP